MKINMPLPKVVGEVKPEIIDNINELWWTTYQNPSPIPDANAAAIASQLKDIYRPGGSEYFTYHASTVAPGEIQRSPDWHVDGEGLFVVNVLPSLVLHGELSIDDDLYQELMLETVTDFDVFQVLSKYLRQFDDGQLKSMGLETWQAKPYEIVQKPNTLIHKGFANNTNSALKRTFCYYGRYRPRFFD